MTGSTLYPIKYGDGGRGGACGASTAAVGRVEWSLDLGSVHTPFWPADVLLWQGHVLVSTYDALRLFDPDACVLWERTKGGGAQPAVAENGALFYRNPDGFIDGVDVAGALVLDAAAFPRSAGRRVTVQSFWPSPGGFLAVLYRAPDDDVRLLEPEADDADGADGADDADDAVDAPAASGRLTVLRSEYPLPYCKWSIDIEGAASLPALLVPGAAIVTVAPGRDVVRVAPTLRPQVELSRFTSPLSEMVEWSVDADELYAMMGYDQGRKALVVFGPDGATRWRWDDHDGDDAWARTQPPVRLSGGRVCALTEGRVLAFDGGALAWAYDLRSEMLRHGARVDDGSFEIRDGRLISTVVLRHATGLADGSLLVTAGRTLLLLGADGRRVFSLALDGDVLSVPVVDAEGAVYVTTATKLFKIL